MKMALARWALPLATAVMPLVASAQFTVVSQTGRLEVRPGVVVNLEPGRLDAVPGYEFFQNSIDASCQLDPNCQPNAFQEITGYSIIDDSFYGWGVFTTAYASGAPVDVVNKAYISLTFDVAVQTDVFLTMFHNIAMDSTGLAPSTTSLSFAQLLDDGSVQNVVLPALGNGSAEKQLRLTLQAGRYVMSSSIAFNPALNFPAGLPSGGPFWVVGGICVNVVPEPGTYALALAGLLAMWAMRSRRHLKA